jgi:hypothetical protein
LCAPCGNCGNGRVPGDVLEEASAERYQMVPKKSKSERIGKIYE